MHGPDEWALSSQESLSQGFASHDYLSHVRREQGDLRRRRWYKVVAALPRSSRRHSTRRPAGASPSLRFVDIEDGVTEYRIGCTTSHFQPSRVCGGPCTHKSAHGFRVCATEAEAVSVGFDPFAPLLYAPRALLVVMASGRPTFHDTREVSFYQITPTEVVAAGDQL